MTIPMNRQIDRRYNQQPRVIRKLVARAFYEQSCSTIGAALVRSDAAIERGAVRGLCGSDQTCIPGRRRIIPSSASLSLI